MLLKAKRWAKVMIGVFSLLFLSLLLQSIFLPFDTTTEPTDMKMLRSYSDRKKLIIREYQNAKTNAIIHDTVLVKDIFIFRQLLKK